MPDCKGPKRQCGRGVAGSGYCKQSDSAKAKELNDQMAAALAARASQDAKMTAAFTSDSPAVANQRQWSQTPQTHGASQAPAAGRPQ
jgi:hypothetical protein